MVCCLGWFAESHLEEIFTAAFGPQFVAARFDPHRLGRGAEAEPSGDAVDEKGHVLILELDHFVAIDTDKMVVIWSVEEIGVVSAFVAAVVGVVELAAVDGVRRSPRLRI